MACQKMSQKGEAWDIFDRSCVKRHSLNQIKKGARKRKQKQESCSYTFAKSNFNFLSNKQDTGINRNSPAQLEFYAWNQLGKRS